MDFFTVKGIFEVKNEPKDKARALRDDGYSYCFGVPFRDLQDSIIVFEGKRTIDPKALGEVVQYLQFLNEARGALLIDDSQFWMITCTRYMRNNEVSGIQICDWTTPGSVLYLRQFIKNVNSEWTELIIDAVTKLDVEIEQGGYLGRGAMGRVFQVKYNEKQVALKIVRGDEHIHQLRREYDVYENLKIDCVASAIHRPVSLCDGNGCAILISPVGKPFSKMRPFAKLTIKRILESLAELHRAGVAHGDARVENLILCNRSTKWIDLVGILYRLDNVREDWLTLVRSILQLKKDVKTPSEIVKAIDEYLELKDLNAVLNSLIK